MFGTERKTVALSRHNFKKIKNFKITREFFQQRVKRHSLSLNKEDMSRCWQNKLILHSSLSSLIYQCMTSDTKHPFLLISLSPYFFLFFFSHVIAHLYHIRHSKITLTDEYSDNDNVPRIWVSIHTVSDITIKATFGI